jgi:hypothetical protein
MRRSFWKSRAIPKNMQPAEQVKPFIYETLSEVYKPLLEKLTSIDEKLSTVEEYIENYAPKVVKNSANEDVNMVKMVKTEDLRK